MYQVPHPEDSGLFRKGGVIVSLAQSVDTVGVAYRYVKPSIHIGFSKNIAKYIGNSKYGKGNLIICI